MTVQKTLKLTALSLGIASIALTGCNKGSDGKNGSDGKSGKAGGINPITATPLPTVVGPNGEIAPAKPTSMILKGVDQYGNQKEVHYDLVDKGSLHITTHTELIPANDCVKFTVSFKSESGEIVINDTTSMYNVVTGIPQDINSIFKVTLEGSSQAKFEIKDGHVCPLRTEGLDLRNSIPSATDKNKLVPNADSREINSFEFAKKFDKVRIVATAINNARVLPAHKELEVTDSHINIIQYLPVEGEVTPNHRIIHAGLESEYPINLEGIISTRDSKGNDLRGSTGELTNKNAEILLAFENGKVIKDALVYRKNRTGKVDGWYIDSKKLEHDYIKNPNVATFQNYIVYVNPNGSIYPKNTLTKELYIAIAAPIIQDIKLHGLKTNVYGTQSFDVKVKYSNSNDFVSVRSLPKKEQEKITIAFEAFDISVQGNNKKITNEIFITNNNLESGNLVETIITAANKNYLIDNNAIKIHEQVKVSKKSNQNDALFALHVPSSTKYFDGNNVKDFYELNVNLSYKSDGNVLSKAQLASLDPHIAAKYKCNFVPSTANSENALIKTGTQITGDNAIKIHKEIEDFETALELLNPKLETAKTAATASNATEEQKSVYKNLQRKEAHYKAAIADKQNLLDQLYPSVVVDSTSTTTVSNPAIPISNYAVGCNDRTYSKETEKVVTHKHHFIVAEREPVIKVKKQYYDLINKTFTHEFKDRADATKILETPFKNNRPIAFAGAKANSNYEEEKFGCVRLVGQLYYVAKNGTVTNMPISSARLADEFDVKFDTSESLIALPGSKKRIETPDLFCPSKAGSAEFNAKFQELKPVRVTVNSHGFIDLPIAKMFFDTPAVNGGYATGKVEHVFTANNLTGVAIRPYILNTSGKYNVSSKLISYEKIAGKFTYNTLHDALNANDSNYSKQYTTMYLLDNSANATSTSKFWSLAFDNTNFDSALSHSQNVSVLPLSDITSTDYSELANLFGEVQEYKEQFNQSVDKIKLEGNELRAKHANGDVNYQFVHKESLAVDPATPTPTPTPDEDAE